ncbi:DNA-binding transcriptional LysR family regulator [Paraburkholderia sp. GAS199]|uniref:LysR substrate-binding domain-containing protein n=1 Tax=Paraburkholderia sp. GAS199 TaxID=3035126 RepID=UPI003D23A727
MKFKLRQMEVFRAVMLTGTVSGAARMLFVSQPAVSRLLNHTETSLGITLFERTGGKLLPTEAAAALFEEVQEVYDAALRVDRFVENLASQSATEIAVSCSPCLGLDLLPEVIEIFSQQNPKARIHFHTTLAIDTPGELLSRKTDLAVVVVPVNNPNLIAEELGTGKMVCVMARNHPLASRETITFEELSTHKTIFASSSIDFGSLIRSTLEAHGFDITPTIHAPRAELAIALARRSLGLAIVDEFSVANNIWGDLVVKPLSQKITYSVSVLTPRFAVRSRMVEQFIQILRNCVRSRAAGDSAN